MNISINNEREKELFEKFIDFLSDNVDSKEMQYLIKESGYSFEDHEIDFIQTGLNQSVMKVDEKIWSVMIPSDNLFGTCKYCGEQWQGVEDEHDVNIYDYERFLHLEKDESYHAECYRMIQCVSCGSDEDTVHVVDEGMLCEDCQNVKGDKQ